MGSLDLESGTNKIVYHEVSNCRIILFLSIFIKLLWQINHINLQMFKIARHVKINSSTNFQTAQLQNQLISCYKNKNSLVTPGLYITYHYKKKIRNSICVYVHAKPAT